MSTAIAVESIGERRIALHQRLSTIQEAIREAQSQASAPGSDAAHFIAEEKEQRRRFEVAQAELRQLDAEEKRQERLANTRAQQIGEMRRKLQTVEAQYVKADNQARVSRASLESAEREREKWARVRESARAELARYESGEK